MFRSTVHHRFSLSHMTSCISSAYILTSEAWNEDLFLQDRKPAMSLALRVLAKKIQKLETSSLRSNIPFSSPTPNPALVTLSDTDPPPCIQRHLD